MKHRVPHSLDRATAKMVTEKAIEEYAAKFSQYSPTSSWQGDDKLAVGFSVKGVKLEGLLTLVEQAIELELKVPMLFRPFKKKALAVIEEEIREWIEKANAGEL